MVVKTDNKNNFDVYKTKENRGEIIHILNYIIKKIFQFLKMIYLKLAIKHSVKNVSYFTDDSTSSSESELIVITLTTGLGVSCIMMVGRILSLSATETISLDLKY